VVVVVVAAVAVAAVAAAAEVAPMLQAATEARPGAGVVGTAQEVVNASQVHHPAATAAGKM